MASDNRKKFKKNAFCNETHTKQAWDTLLYIRVAWEIEKSTK